MPRAMRSTRAEMLNIRKEALQILIDLQTSETIRRKMWEDKLIVLTKCEPNTAWMVVNEYIQKKNLVKRVLIVKGGQNHKYCLSVRGRGTAGQTMGRLTKALSSAEASDEAIGVDADDTRGKRIFVIHGPYEIPCDRLRSGRIIHPLHGAQLWAKPGVTELKLRGKIGCYLYALRAGKGYTPLYVGQTTVGFGKECFTDGKLNRYNHGLARVKAGTPVLFFVTPSWNARPTKKKKSAVAQLIGEIEKHLIALASSANPSGLLNTQHTKKTWGIRGMHRGLGGKGNRSSANFRRMLNLGALTH